MSRVVEVISPNNGSGWYWEVRTDDGVIERGLANTHADAISQATAAKTAAANVEAMVKRALEPN